MRRRGSAGWATGALACGLGLWLGCDQTGSGDRSAKSRASLASSEVAVPANLAPHPSAVPRDRPPGSPEPAADPLRPLGPDERQQLAAGPVDAPQAVEIHYIQSNETRHDLFFPFIEGKGGALVGVGSDQSLTLAAAAQAELVLLLDIDQRVVDLHRLYAVLVPQADDAAALVRAFDRSQRDATAARLEAAFADRPAAERRRLLREFRAGRETVFRHLQRVLDRDVDGRATSWLSDPRMFAHVQRLYRAGRVRSMPGDLTGTDSMKTAGAAARSLGIPVRVLYLSNAEEYFGYTPQFIDNLGALPFDEGALVLRTIYADRWPHADLWAYQVQPLPDLVERLVDGRGRSRNGMLRQAAAEGAVDREPGPRGLSLVGIGPAS